MSRRRASPGRATGASCSCTSPPTSCRSASAIGWAIITEASVSFLGFGDSNSVSWGMMLQDAFASQALSRGQYAWFVPPGVCIILVVVAGFFISRGYEEVFMPRLRGR
jgi:peptide/nickel transport system permease protein